MSTITANMNLVVPTVGNTIGPTYASDINSSLTLVDSHDHTSGKGVPITPGAININSQLQFNNNFIRTLAGATFTSQNSTPANQTAYVSGTDLYFVDGLGNNVRITQSGGVAGSPGSISSLSAPASATYVSGSSTFVWQSNTNIAANLDAGSLLMRNLSPNSTYALTLAPPASLSANYTITLPSLPASQSFLTIGTGGNITGYASINQGITKSNLAPVGQQISASSGLYTTTATTPQSVTNLSVTITTTGRPVFVGLIADGSASSSWIGINRTNNGDYIEASYRILEDGSSISHSIIGLKIQTSGTTEDPISYIPVSSLYTISVPSAGSHTYAVTVESNASGTNVYCYNAKLIAYEL